MTHRKLESSSRTNKVIAMTTYKTPSDTCLHLLLFNLFSADGADFLEWLNEAKTVLAAKDLVVFCYVDTTERLPCI